ncbi:hypothetical protein P12x_000379 [Tundrisphaera lichenicola]|uniref:hypothetical protein n=1 Tax=Tundrisphaera lichenicola TaxID=2029860 RepID=UPI003EBF5952
MDPLVIPIVGMLIPIIIVPTALGIKHAKFLREAEHTERMKALELGRTLPSDESWSPASIATAIGAGVPLGSMGIAWMASNSSHGADESIWMSACMVAIGGLICGTILASRHFATRNQMMQSDIAKPAYDPDAYDVVGRRG